MLSVLIGVALILALPGTSLALRLPGLLSNTNVRHPFQVRPAVVGYTGDGTGFLGGFDGKGERGHFGHMTWLTWTRRVATGSGALWGDDCKPDCAEGTFSPVPVKVRAFAPHRGHFTRLTLRYHRNGARSIRRTRQCAGIARWFLVPRATTNTPQRTALPVPKRAAIRGANNTGPGGEGRESCASYPEEGEKLIETAGEIKEKRFTGVTIRANNVTLNDVCIIGASEKRVNLVEGANFTIENSVIRGTGTAKSEATEEALQNSSDAPNARAINNDISNCGECVHQAWTLEGSYVLTNTSPGSSPHYEDIYASNGTSFTANHDTLFNIENQTAVFFQEGYKNSGAVASVTNSFLAGGGYMLHPVGTVTFTGDRFARCLTTPLSPNRVAPTARAAPIAIYSAGRTHAATFPTVASLVFGGCRTPNASCPKRGRATTGTTTWKRCRNPDVRWLAPRQRLLRTGVAQGGLMRREWMGSEPTSPKEWPKAISSRCSS